MTTFKNFTPHPVKLNNGTVFPSMGVCRVSASFTPIDEHGICRQILGELTGLPEPEEGTIFIVSALALEKAKQLGRTDCVAPASGHPETVRENGLIVSVPCFIA